MAKRKIGTAEFGQIADGTRRPFDRITFRPRLMVNTTGLDLTTKLIVQNTLHFLEPRPIIGDVVRFTLVYNSGAAFSMSLGPYSRVAFGTFAVIALVILW